VNQESPKEKKSSGERSSFWGVALILLLALGLRLAFLGAWVQSEFYACPILDPLTFQELGRRVATQGMAGLGLIWRAPLYPVLLGLLWRTFGDSWLLPLLLQVLLSTLSVGLLYSLSRPLLGDTRSRLACLLFALNWISIFFSVQLLITTLFTFLCLATLLALVKLPVQGKGGVLWAGFLAGLTTLARPTILICVAAWGLWIGLCRGGWARAMLFLGACLITISPATWQNYRVSGHFIPISAIGGYNFFIGNGPGADGKTVWAAQKSLQTMNLPPDLDPPENQRRYLQATWKEVSHHPLRWLGLMGRKLYYLLNSYEISSNLDLYGSVFQLSPWLAVLSLLSFGVLFPLALVGLLWAPLNRPRAAPVLVFLAVFPATLLFFFVNARFRAPLLPLVCLFAAPGASFLWQERPRLLSQHRIKLLLLVLLVVLCNSRAFEVDAPEDLVELRARHAAAFLRAKRLQEALQEAEAALDLDATHIDSLAIRREIWKRGGH
jgi:hypothetical protein